MDVTTPDANHVVKVTFFNAYDIFSNATGLSSSCFNGEKMMLYSTCGKTRTETKHDKPKECHAAVDNFARTSEA